MIQISEKVKFLKPSLTRTLFNLAKSYDDVIDFTLGDPDILPHNSIREAGCQAILKGKTRYSQNAGLKNLRDIISQNYKEESYNYYDPDSEIIVTVGGMEGLFLALLGIINPNDEIIIPAPYWINYAQMVQMCGGTPVVVNPKSKTDLSISIENIKKAITDKSRAIIINTPSNPSGIVITKEDLKDIADLAIKNDLIIITDEVYKKLVYEKIKFYSISNLPLMKERTVVINSLSKEFCMTGWRLGYVVAPKELIAVMTMMQENVAACAPLPSQYAAIEALSHRVEYSKDMIDIFSRRKSKLIQGIRNIDKLSVREPDATFYAMVNIAKTGLNSEEFAYQLLEKAHVAVVPGITYGKCCEDFIRIAFTINENMIDEGVKRIRDFVVSL